ncbi:putative WD40-repeat-containing domain-containing protein [Plasmopara halstedii]
MASPSSARILMDSNTKRIQSSKRDVTGRSRLLDTSMSQSSRHVNGSVANVNGGPSGSGSKHSTRVYLNGLDVTPQSLLVSCIKSTTSATTKKSGKFERRNRSKASRAMVGVSQAGASFLVSNVSSSSADHDSDSEGSSSFVGTSKSQMVNSKDVEANIQDSIKSNSNMTSTVNQNEGEGTKVTVIADQNDLDDSIKEDTGKELIMNEEAGVEAMLFGNRKSMLISGRSRYRTVTVKMSETATDMIFERRSVCVAVDAPEYHTVVARNKQYQAICAQKKASDKYIEGRTQTLQLAQKAKEVMTAPPATRDAACVATDWDIYDCGKQKHDTNVEGDDDGVKETISMPSTHTKSSANQIKERLAIGLDLGNAGDLQLKEQVEEIVGATLVSPGCVLDVDGDIVEDLRARRHRASRPRRKTRDRRKHNSQYSQRSRPFDSQRSTIIRMSGSSNVSVLRGDQSSGSLSTDASQDFIGRIGADGASSGSIAASSQAGMSVANASRADNGRAGRSGDEKVDSVYARADTNVDLGEIITRQRTSHVLQSSSLLRLASIVERAVQQNVYHEQQVKYRDLSILETDESVVDTKSSDELEKLWIFSCALTQNRTVSCLTWNTANDDLLAVSYGPNQSQSTAIPATGSKPAPVVQPGTATAATTQSITGTALEKEGLVLFWSLTNPEYPERIYHFPASVTSFDFSSAHPYLLAIGFADGIVSIYDTRKNKSASSSFPPNGLATDTNQYLPDPIATSSGQTGRHLDTVWQVKWVQHGGSEHVVSVSADGRVVEWSLKKGLSSSDLMTLKCVPNPLLGSLGSAIIGRSEGVLSRQASGRSLAFANQDDPSVYYVGTEDGLVHKCSVSYNEQYLQTYIGHTGPVYQLLVSPFCPDVFLSCSGDWKLKIWHQSEGEAMLTLHSVDLTKAVLGASWSSNDAGVFAAVSEDGRIELWDLLQSTLDPIVGHFPKKYMSVTVKSETGGNDLAQDGAYDDADQIVDKEEYVTTLVEVPLECTTVAFAPKAPVLIVGDSTGDVTVYRVPAKVTHSAIGTQEIVTHREDQAAKLLRAIRSTKYE